MGSPAAGWIRNEKTYFVDGCIDAQRAGYGGDVEDCYCNAEWFAVDEGYAVKRR